MVTVNIKVTINTLSGDNSLALINNKIESGLSKLLLQTGTYECTLWNRHIQDITRRCNLAAERTVCWDFQWTVTSRCHYLWCGCQNILHWRLASEKWFLPAVMEEWSCELLASAGDGAQKHRTSRPLLLFWWSEGTECVFKGERLDNPNTCVGGGWGTICTFWDTAVFRAEGRWGKVEERRVAAECCQSVSSCVCQ